MFDIKRKSIELGGRRKTRCFESAAGEGRAGRGLAFLVSDR